MDYFFRERPFPIYKSGKSCSRAMTLLLTWPFPDVCWELKVLLHLHDKDLYGGTDEVGNSSYWWTHRRCILCPDQHDWLQKSVWEFRLWMIEKFSNWLLSPGKTSSTKALLLSPSTMKSLYKLQCCLVKVACTIRLSIFY